MCASPLSFLRAGPPPPKVALLPDAMFFTRNVPIAPGATPADVAAQVELSLEALSPFPVTQLYHGYFWTPGAERALVFASYRRRFTSEETDTWAGAELVLPAFASVLGAQVAPATTLVLVSPEGLTAVHWESAAMPSQVIFRALPPEATDDDRAKAREELLRVIGGSRTVVDVPHPPAAEPATSDEEIVFKAGAVISRLPKSVSAAVDVRDKAQLAVLRRAQWRDRFLWRVAVGSAAALILLAVGELSLIGANQLWQKSRLAKLNRQMPTVERIMTSDTQTKRVEELVTKRLLPFEMLTEIVGVNRDRMPGDVIFTRVQTDGIYTLHVNATTTNIGQISVYQSALEKLPSVQKVDVVNEGARGATATFRLTVAFKPEAIKPTLPL